VTSVSIFQQVSFYYNSRLRVKLEKESYIGLIQENSIEFLLQTSLSYMPHTIVCTHTTTNLF